MLFFWLIVYVHLAFYVFNGVLSAPGTNVTLVIGIWSRGNDSTGTLFQAQAFDSGDEILFGLERLWDDQSPRINMAWFPLLSWLLLVVPLASLGGSQ